MMLSSGLGWAMVVISTLTSIYYNMVIAYTLYFMFASFTSELPWSSCRDEWIPYGCKDDYNATIRNQTGKGLATNLAQM